MCMMPATGQGAVIAYNWTTNKYTAPPVVHEVQVSGNCGDKDFELVPHTRRNRQPLSVVLFWHQ